VCRMEPVPTRERRAQRLKNHRRQTRLREIGRLLKADYDTDGRLPMSARLMGLLNAIDRPQCGKMEPGSK
jgi:hypothetical protein